MKLVPNPVFPLGKGALLTPCSDCMASLPVENNFPNPNVNRDWDWDEGEVVVVVVVAAKSESSEMERLWCCPPPLASALIRVTAGGLRVNEGVSDFVLEW